MQYILILNLLVLHVFSIINLEPYPSGGHILAVDIELLRNPEHIESALSEHFSHNLDTDFELGPYKTVSVTNQDQDYPFLESLTDICLGGSRSKDLEERLTAFKKGICTPAILVPGILGTALVVDIDCLKLKAWQNGTIFKNCGWDTCQDFVGKKPAKSYMLWVGVELMAKPLFGPRKCFGDLLGLRYNISQKSQNPKKKYYEPNGVRSTWFGNTKYTKDVSKCGANAIGDLAGVDSILNLLGSQCATKGYKRMLKMMRAMGYEQGITMQPIPYDFRYGILAGDTTVIIPQAINNLYFTTGKKVVVIAHSLGTLHTLSSLAFFMTKKQKDRMVRHYIPITPPWFGTVSAIRNTIVGDSTYYDNSSGVGINFYAQMRFSRSSGGTMELFLRDAFQTSRTTKWMKDILQRIEYEKKGGSDPKQKNPLDWYPNKQEHCFNPIFKRDPRCLTGLIDFQTTPIITVNDTKYYGNVGNITKLIQDTVPSPQSQQILDVWNQTKVNNLSLDSIPAPGVDTSMIYTTLFDTQIYYEFETSPKDKVSTDNGSFVKETVINFTLGDQSVPSFSPLVFITKWLAEGNDGKDVQAVQYCGEYKGLRAHYSTLKCNCVEDPFTNPLDCVHSCIISDKYLIQFVIGILTNKNKGYQQPGLDDAIPFTSDQLWHRREECFNLQPYSKIGGRVWHNKQIHFHNQIGRHFHQQIEGNIDA